MEVKEIVYRVIFSHLDQIYTLYSQGLSEETLVGFIEVDGVLSYSHDSQPTSAEAEPLAEQYKINLEHIKRTYIPMHAIIRIDEMTRKHYDYTVKGEQAEHVNVRHIHGGKYSAENTEDV